MACWQLVALSHPHGVVEKAASCPSMPEKLGILPFLLPEEEEEMPHVPDMTLWRLCPAQWWQAEEEGNPPGRRAETQPNLVWLAWANSIL